MSRDLMDETYYMSHGGMIPVKWTAPEVTICINCHWDKIMNSCVNSDFSDVYMHFSRLSTTRSTPLLVMCGVMEFSCMRYGVWDTNHLKTSQIIRYTYRLHGEVGLRL